MDGLSLNALRFPGVFLKAWLWAEDQKAAASLAHNQQRVVVSV